ncbi:hypothetical protein BBK36DRAFT_1119413 [Trichoderma citrinoviride]|uniref:Uncharacterized protein n=1 Tax=Trichoderma citrinoviride TaxID=58853 RepID=A0A2T4BAM9_9HYPO|nr:hypothetical protein BBK36DRAFT_1119413 [Trichoderma citrinoviride]PTB66291.1 hypothetical protein BBK36DRAFT_1119413 [Trichoderma citrinoviride]
MSNPFNFQFTDGGDFTDPWQDDNADTGYFGNNGFAGTASPEHTFAEEQSEMNLGTLEFLTAADPFKPDMAMTQDNGMGIDLALDWLVSDTSNNQLSSTSLQSNAIFPSNNDLPLLPFGQQIPAYSLQQHVDQNNDQDDPFSAYPPLGFDDGTNSLPYGQQFLQQSSRALPLTTGNQIFSTSFFEPASEKHLQSDNYQRQSTADSETAPEAPKVSLNRAAKRRGDPSCDPSRHYTANLVNVSPWGSRNWNGNHLFSYTPKGQWLRDRCFNKKQLQEYVDNCSKETVFWVQQAPTQCNHRLDPEDRVCRWANCPVANRTIAAGWLRVAFDEFPHLTSNGLRDPLKCAGSMHLWCFEQAFDPLKFHLAGRLRAEDREFPLEDKSVVTLEKLTDAGIIREAYQPWFMQRMRHPNQPPREYRDTLSYQLTRYHVDNQTAARQKARSKRNTAKSADERRTIDVHLGNLQLFVEITNKVKKSKKARKLQRARVEDDEDSNPASQAWRNGDPMAATNWYPEQSQGEFLSLLGLSSGSIQRREVNTPHSNAMLKPNMSSRPPSFFDPLNPGRNAMQSSFQRPVATSLLQNSLTGIPNHTYSQTVTGARFNKAIRGQPRQLLRPVTTQNLQHSIPSGTTVPCQVQTPQPTRRLNNQPNSSLATQPNVFLKHEPSWTPFESSQSVGGSSGTGFFDSQQGSSPRQEELNLADFIDPSLFGDEPVVGQHHEEAVVEASDESAAQPMLESIELQPQGSVDGVVSPQTAASSQYWDGLDSLVDTAGFGGFDDSSFPSLFDGVDERATTLTGVVSISSSEASGSQGKNLGHKYDTRSRQNSKRRRTDTS